MPKGIVYRICDLKTPVFIRGDEKSLAEGHFSLDFLNILQFGKLEQVGLDESELKRSGRLRDSMRIVELRSSRLYSWRASLWNVGADGESQKNEM